MQPHIFINVIIIGNQSSVWLSDLPRKLVKPKFKFIVISRAVFFPLCLAASHRKLRLLQTGKYFTAKGTTETGRSKIMPTNFDSDATCTLLVSCLKVPFLYMLNKEGSRCREQEQKKDKMCLDAKETLKRKTLFVIRLF